MRLRLLVLPILVALARTAHAEALKAPVVFVETVKPVDLADVITYPARIASRVKAQVYAPSDGVVTRIDAPLGTSVHADSSLMRIKNIDPVYTYVPVAVETPVAGVVSAIDVTVGSKVTKGQALATVTDPRQIMLQVEVPAADLGSLAQGSEGTFTAPLLGPDAKPLKVRVTGLSPLIDPATGTATAELVFIHAATRPVPLGVLGKVSFAINGRRGFQVPEEAIIYRGSETLVRTVVGGKAKLTPITVTETRHGRTEVLSGLAAGAQVIIRSSGFIADGQSVTVEDGHMATN